MTAVIVGLLPTEELALLKCYIKGKREPDWADAFYDAIGVPKNPIPPRLEVAVAQILLHHVQGSLPQWSAAIGEEIVFLTARNTSVIQTPGSSSIRSWSAPSIGRTAGRATVGLRPIT